MKKIAFFQKNMGNDGISNALRNLINTGFLNEYDIDLYIVQQSDSLDFNEHVHVYYLPDLPYINRIVPFDILYLSMKRMDSTEYEYAIDYNGYQNSCALYCLKTKAKKHICWIHNDFYEQRERWQNCVYFTVQIGKWKYFDEFVAVSYGAKSGFCKLTGISSSKIKVLPNAINWDKIEMMSQRFQNKLPIDEKYINILTVGRLDKQKGVDQLLHIMSTIENDKMRLYIMGNGEKKKEYVTLAKKLGITDKVFFIGNRNNPYAVMSQMDALVLNSRYEGQGLVLVEAKYLGVPIIFPEKLDKYTILMQGVEDMHVEIEKLSKMEPTGINQGFRDEYMQIFSKLIQDIFL